MLKLNLLVGLWLGLAAASPQERLQDCVRQFRSNPQSYEHARCLYTVSQRNKAIASTALDELSEEFPESIYLRIIRAHLLKETDLLAARAIYEQAAEAFAKQGNDDGECIARSNVLVTYYRSGERADILRALERLQAIEEQTKDPIARARATLMIAGAKNVHYWSIGKQYRKLRSFTAQDEERLPFSVLKLLYLNRGHAAYAHGDLALALRDADRLADLAKKNSNARTLAQAHRLAARVRTRQHAQEPSPARFKQAEQVLQTALASARASNHRYLEVIAKSSLASLWITHPTRHPRALAFVNDCLTASEQTYPALQGRCTVIKSRLAASRSADEALHLAARAVDHISTTASGLDHATAWRNFMQRAWHEGDTQDAREATQHALRAIEELRCQQQSLESRRRVFSAWANDYYWVANKILKTTHSGTTDAEAIERAFSMTEHARARTLFEERERDLRNAKQQGDAQRPGVHRPLDPCPTDERVDVPSKPYATIPELQAQLRPDEALVVYQASYLIDGEGEDHGGAWLYCITARDVSVQNLKLARSEIVTSVQITRGSLGTSSQSEVLSAFRRKLWDPARNMLPESTRSVILVPDASLSLIPWQSVDPELGFSLASSATNWLRAVRNAPRRMNPRGLVMVDPENPEHLLQNDEDAARLGREENGVLRQSGRRLLHSQAEARAIQEQLGPAIDVLQQARARKDALFRHWGPGLNLLHISAHSMPSEDDARILKIALASPNATTSEWLGASDIEQLPLEGSLVVLAGCSTGWGESIVGDGVLSLARSFQRAGARTVVASLWPVDDATSARFFETFYAQLGRGLSVQDALGYTKRELQTRGTYALDYAGFTVLGDGRFQFASTDRPFAHTLTWITALLASCAGILAIGMHHYRRRRRARSVGVR